MMHRLRVLQSTASLMMFARVAGAGAGFLAQLALARLLPPDQVGRFFAATSLAAVLGLIAAQGYPNIVQRFFTQFRSVGDQSLSDEFFGEVQRQALGLGTIFIVILLAVAFLTPDMGADLRALTIATAFCVFSATAFSIYPSFANANRQYALALLPETLIRPVVFLALIVAIGFYSGLTESSAVIIYAALSAVLALAQCIAVGAPAMLRMRRAARPWRRKWRQEAWPLIFVALFTVLFADVVILQSSFYLMAPQVASFGVALKISMLVGFVVQVSHQLVQPDLAHARESGDDVMLSRALGEAVWMPVMVTLAALVAAAVWGQHLLVLFGPEYASAYGALLVLIGAQCVRAAAGPAPSLLTLAGAQRTNAAITIASACVLLITGAPLTSYMGVFGASLAVLSCILTWTGLSAFMSWRQLGLRTDAFRVAIL